MFLVKSADGEEMSLKPMNCPGHFLLFASEMRSYKDLPLRFHEQTPLHRNEASGVLSGLTRVRQFSQDDGHCFVTRGADRRRRSRRCSALIQRVYGDFGLSYTAKLSTRPEKFLGEVATWDRRRGGAEAGARARRPGRTRSTPATARSTARRSTSTSPTPSAASGSARTIQLDYMMPQRFDLKYIGADNTEHRPVVIHRAIFGSIERFIAILIEHFAGAFPLWLAPVQVDGAADCRSARRVRPAACSAQLAAAGLRVERRRAAGEDQLQDPRGAAAEGALHAGRRRPRGGGGGGGGAQPRQGRPRRPARSTQFVADALAEVAAKTVS